MTDSTAPAATGGYRRVLSAFDGTMIVIGSIIGAGIFFNPTAVAGLVHEPWAILAVWAFGGIIALTGALTYAELGGMQSRAGGVYVFLRDAFGGLPAFLYAWTLIFVIAPGALAVVASFFAHNLDALLGADLGPGALQAIALLTIVGLTVTNIIGVRLASYVQNLFTGAKLVALALLIGGGLIYAGAPLGPPAQNALAAVDAGSTTATAHGLAVSMALAMIPIMFTYGGWQNGTYIAAEMKRPGRDVPIAVIGGTLVVVACYMLVNAAYLNVLTPAAIAGSKTFASRVATVALGAHGGMVVTAGICISMFGICAAILLTNPRVAQAAAEDGLLLEPLGRLHPTHGTPAWSIAALGAWACVLLVIGRAGQLLDAVVFADWLFFTLVAVCLFVLRRTQPDAARPYRCPLYPWVPTLFLLLAAAMTVVSFVKADTTSRILGPGVVAAGIPIYLWRRPKR